MGFLSTQIQRELRTKGFLDERRSHLNLPDVLVLAKVLKTTLYPTVHQILNNTVYSLSTTIWFQK